MQPRQVNVKRAEENRQAVLLYASKELPVVRRGAQSIQRKRLVYLYYLFADCFGCTDNPGGVAL